MLLKKPIATSTTTVENRTNHPAFGMQMPGRTWQGTSDNYRYGFNNEENDKALSSGAQDFGLREYDNRLGRFFRKDPLTKYLPNKSPYAFAGNSPITFIDEDGGYMVVPGISGVRGKKLKSLQRLAKAVSTLANEKGGDNEFVNMFMLASGLTDKSKALEILTYGTGPIIVVNDEPEIMASKRGDLAAGKYYGADVEPAKEFIFINAEIITGMKEKSSRREGPVNLFSYIIGIATLWHEGIHYADNLDCTPQKGEAGIQGESNLFGFEPGYKTLQNYNSGYMRDLKGERIRTPQLIGFKQGYDLGSSEAQTAFFKMASSNTYRGNPGFSINNLAKVKQTLNTAMKAIKSITTAPDKSYGNDRFLH